jgi:hypothetical protein
MRSANRASERPNRSFKVLVAAMAILPLVACLSVHLEDLNAWTGAPVSALDKHPIFLTLPVVKTMAADGTEIRNYVNGRNVTCTGSASGVVSLAVYSSFTNYIQAFPACNNIFYIKNGVVTQYTPIGTGGARCYTDERLRPWGATQGTNIR